MKPGELIEVVAAAVQMSKATVTVYARTIREAGLLTSGARGVNAPNTTPLDAARILIALMAAPKPVQAAEVVRDFGNLKCSSEDVVLDDPNHSFTFMAAKKLPDDHSFEEGIAALIDMYVNGEPEDYFDGSHAHICRIALRRNSLDAFIRLPGAAYSYCDPGWRTPPTPLPDTPTKDQLADEAFMEQWEAEMDAISAAEEDLLRRTSKYRTSRIRIEAEVRSDVVDAIAEGFRQRNNSE